MISFGLCIGTLLFFLSYFKNKYAHEIYITPEAENRYQRTLCIYLCGNAILAANCQKFRILKFWQALEFPRTE